MGLAWLLAVGDARSLQATRWFSDEQFLPAPVSAVAVLDHAQVDDLAVRALVFAGSLLLTPDEEV